MNTNNIKVLVRGAGDIATGIIWSLCYCGMKVVCVDIEKPSCIRTEVSFSTAIYEGEKEINGIICKYVKNTNEIEHTLNEGKVPLLIDPTCEILKTYKFDVLVDAILAKKNLGTKIDMANLVIGVGPGFTTSIDCHYAIETMRGHDLATIISNGSPIPNTGVPGLIASHGEDRVMHSPSEGIFNNIHKIGDVVKRGDILSKIRVFVDNKPTGESVNLIASIDGVLRGILKNGFYASKGLKCADIDPRMSEAKNCFTISDKARSIGNSVVVAIMHEYGGK